MMRLSMIFFPKDVDQRHQTMESFTKELVSNASTQALTYNTISSFTKLSA